ncbi:MAG: hypothetical protein WC350_00015 [Candidatus Micrarchaeia archaeon]|jgi:hypothetical protein
MTYKNTSENPGDKDVWQMFELSPLVDVRGSLKILIKRGLAEQSGFLESVKDKEKYKFYGWFDAKEGVLKIKVVERRDIDRLIQSPVLK